MKRIALIFTLLWLVGVVGAQDDEIITPQDLADDNGAFTMVNGAEIYYVTEGDPSNPAVMMIHGFGGSTFTWRDNIGAIADAGYYAVALDLPPFGLSDKSVDLDYSRSGFADIVVGLMDELGIETATIMGHSMGGGVTAYVAVRHTERVDSLIFVAGGVFETSMVSEEDEENTGDSPFAFLDSINPESEQAADLLRLALRPVTFGQIIATAYYDAEAVTDEVIDGYARPLQLENWAEGFLAYSVAEETEPITLDSFAEAAAGIPVQIIWGVEDTWVPIGLGEAMDAVLGGVDFVTYPETGHLPMEENTEMFNDDVITFLTTVGDSPIAPNLTNR
ncbi:MAG: alpha/beta hydrolase [Chloroflexota bacterium]